jgi:CheY-like chemotaxis protein
MKEVNFLLVDDSPIIKNIVKKVLLGKVGAQAVHMAETYAEALDVLNTKKIDVILCNWDTPDITQNKLLSDTRRNRDWRRIPFIIMTAIDTKEFFVSALQGGAAQCLVRPFTVDQLEDIVRKSWTAASKRQAARFSALPTHRMSVKQSVTPVEAKLLNISRSGCLVRIEYTDALRLFEYYELAADFDMPEAGRKYSVSKIVGTIIRLEKDSSHTSDPHKKVCQMALYFNPAHMDKQGEQMVDDMMRWLESMNPETVITK